MINDVDVQHTMLLLKLVYETKKVRKMQEDTLRAYRFMMAQKSCETYEYLEAKDPNWRYWDPDKKGKVIVDFLHAGCCDEGKAGEMVMCKIDPLLEADVCACIKRTIANKEQYKRLCAIRDSEGNAIRHTHTSKELEKAIRNLDVLRIDVINNYFPIAAWKRECGKEMTSFEDFITDFNSISVMGLLEPDECARVIRSVGNSVRCKRNKNVCRGCYKIIKNNQRPKSNKKNKRRNQQQPISCTDCKAVYFCSETCRLAGCMGRHQAVECKMIQEQSRQLIKKQPI